MLAWPNCILAWIISCCCSCFVLHLDYQLVLQLFCLTFWCGPITVLFCFTCCRGLIVVLLLFFFLHFGVDQLFCLTFWCGQMNVWVWILFCFVFGLSVVVAVVLFDILAWTHYCIVLLYMLS